MSIVVGAILTSAGTLLSCATGLELTREQNEAARTLVNEQRWDDALAETSKALEVALNYESYAIAASCSYQLGDYERAARYCNSALEHYPEKLPNLWEWQRLAKFGKQGMLLLRAAACLAVGDHDTALASLGALEKRALELLRYEIIGTGLGSPFDLRVADDDYVFNIEMFLVLRREVSQRRGDLVSASKDIRRLREFRRRWKGSRGRQLLAERVGRYDALMAFHSNVFGSQSQDMRNVGSLDSQLSSNDDLVDSTARSLARAERVGIVVTASVNYPIRAEVADSSSAGTRQRANAWQEDFGERVSDILGVKHAPAEEADLLISAHCSFRRLPYTTIDIGGRRGSTFWVDAPMIEVDILTQSTALSIELSSNGPGDHHDYPNGRFEDADRALASFLDLAATQVAR